MMTSAKFKFDIKENYCQSLQLMAVQKLKNWKIITLFRKILLSKFWLTFKLYICAYAKSKFFGPVGFNQNFSKFYTLGQSFTQMLHEDSELFKIVPREGWARAPSTNKGLF